MMKYVKKILKDFPEKIKSTSPSPAADHLFQIKEECKAKTSPEEKAKWFHHSVAQLLFLSPRARKDIQTTVAFLTTRVKIPDEDDWGKLKRVMKYLKGTNYLKLALAVDKIGFVKW